MKSPIILRGCRQNNLKGFDLEIPRGKYVAVTGVSGSGKSSLAFDTLYAEGQRRYVESFSAYARQFLERMDRPAIDSVEGIPPAVAIAQGNNVRSSRSSVGTVTEINDYVKLLFARLGVRHCDRCGRPVQRLTPSQIVDEMLKHLPEGEQVLIGFELGGVPAEDFEDWRADLMRRGFIRIWLGKEIVRIAELKEAPKEAKLRIVLDRIAVSKEKRSRLIEAFEQAFAHGNGRAISISSDNKVLHYDRELRCAHCDLRYSELSPNQFSFNTPVGACPECKGFGRVIEIDPNLVVPDPTRSIAEGAIKPWTTEKTQEETNDLHRFCRARKISLHTPWAELPEETKKSIWEGEPGGWREKKWYGIRGWFDWLETKIYKLHVRVLLSRYRVYLPCKTCGGTRFKKESLQTKLGGKNIAELYALSLLELKKFFDALEIPKSQKGTGESLETVAYEIRTRLGYLCEVGLDYLSLDRSSRTLSGGEMQRVNLTTAVGSSLVNTLFVLDEPSVGLHSRDNDRLIGLFKKLTSRQNSVVVVEHDPAILKAAEHLIDMGPKAGEAGGEVVYQGSVSGVTKEKRSATGRYLSGQIPLVRTLKKNTQKNAFPDSLSLKGVKANNLKNLNINFPVGALTCVTGVSGSGKSTLVEDVLYRGILRKRGEPVEEPGECQKILGWDQFFHVSLVDQSPISKSPKSIFASYSGIQNRIRTLLAKTDAARERGFSASVFSTGSAGGRCETCEGAGVEKIEMQFLADVYLPCQECGGARFKSEVLKVRYHGKNIREIYDLTIDQAQDFFRGDLICAALSRFSEIGLGYLKLGQPLNSLSGGEAQRLKLALALQDSVGHNKTGLFLFDEPTTGLHGADLPPLIAAFDRLLAAGHTLIVIEHNLEIIALADYVIDLGPEGGAAGGEIVASGTPKEIAANPKSVTGKYLKEVMEARS